MSKERAKRKRRQRARAAGGGAAGGPVSEAERRERAERRAAGRGATEGDGAERGGASAGQAKRRTPVADGGEAKPAPRPSRLDERDGVRRPDAIWAPFPLTEIGMAVGLGVFAVGFFSTGDRGPWLVTIGAVVLAVVVAELCLREHFAGFRSHSLLLGLLPVTGAHVAVYTFLSDAWRGPIALAVDLAIAGGLAMLLQRRFRVAQERAQLRAPR